MSFLRCKDCKQDSFKKGKQEKCTKHETAPDSEFADFCFVLEKHSEHSGCHCVCLFARDVLEIQSRIPRKGHEATEIKMEVAEGDSRSDSAGQNIMTHSSQVLLV